ncbi:hypothetical protein ABK040_007125 [Willaertia magna]
MLNGDVIYNDDNDIHSEDELSIESLSDDDQEDERIREALSSSQQLTNNNLLLAATLPTSSLDTQYHNLNNTLDLSHVTTPLHTPIYTPPVMNHPTIHDLTNNNIQHYSSLPITNQHLTPQELIDLNENYKELLRSELEKIEEEQRQNANLQRKVRTSLMQKQKAICGSAPLFPAKKGILDKGGKFSKKPANEFFLHLVQQKFKSKGINALLPSQLLNDNENLNSTSLIKKKTNKKKKRSNNGDLSDSEFEDSDNNEEEEEENQMIETITSSSTKEKVSFVINGPVPNEDVIKREPFVKKMPLVFETKKWTTVEVKNLRYAVRQQHQELRCKFVLQEYKNNLVLMKKEFENVKRMTAQELEDIDSNKIDWEKVSKYHVKTKTPFECKKYWEIELATDIKKDSWTKEEDIALLQIADKYKGHNWELIAEELFQKIGHKRRPIHCFRRYQRSLNINMMRSKWTKEEDMKLIEAVKLYGEKNWQQIASHLEGRTGQQCLHRWLKTLDPKIKKGKWTVEEDKRLIMAVHAYPPNNWVLVQRHVPGRTDVQCRERWCNILNPTLNVGPWTKEEDERLKQAIKEYGLGNWSKIAEVMHPRTDNQCWRRWRIINSEEVPDYRKKINTREKALVRNFVGREKERPEITADDFAEIQLYNLYGEEYSQLVSFMSRLKEQKRSQLLECNNPFISKNIYEYGIKYLIEFIENPSLRSAINLECQRIDQLQYLSNTVPYYIGVPPSNLIKKTFSLFNLFVDHKYLSFGLCESNDSQDTIVIEEEKKKPIFTYPCIIPQRNALSLPCIPATTSSMNSLAALHSLLYDKQPPKRRLATLTIESSEEEEHQVTLPMPPFFKTVKDFSNETPSLQYNDPSILQSTEFKMLTSVFNSLFQKPMQQYMNTVAERLPYLLRRVPGVDVLNSQFKQKQEEYKQHCNHEDLEILRRNELKSSVFVEQGPQLPTVFQLYQHIPQDDTNLNKQLHENENSLASLTTKKKGNRGRPKGSKNKKPSKKKDKVLMEGTIIPEQSIMNEDSNAESSSNNTQPSNNNAIVDESSNTMSATNDNNNTQNGEQQQGVKRGRGRPKGSKNKPKTLEQISAQKRKQMQKPVVRRVSQKKRKTVEEEITTIEDDDEE